MALSHSDVEVLALTSVFGNASLEETAYNNLRVLQMADRLEVRNATVFVFQQITLFVRFYAYQINQNKLYNMSAVHMLVTLLMAHICTISF